MIDRLLCFTISSWTMAKPIRTVRPVKKRTKKFIRFQSDKFKRVKVRASAFMATGTEITGHPYTGVD